VGVTVLSLVFKVTLNCTKDILDLVEPLLELAPNLIHHLGSRSMALQVSIMLFIETVHIFIVEVMLMPSKANTSTWLVLNDLVVFIVLVWMRSLRNEALVLSLLKIRDILNFVLGIILLRMETSCTHVVTLTSIVRILWTSM
jgi:hypothetical protein